MSFDYMFPIFISLIVVIAIMNFIHKYFITKKIDYDIYDRYVELHLEKKYGKKMKFYVE
jgi:hypothetical protein